MIHVLTAPRAARPIFRAKAVRVRGGTVQAKIAWAPECLRDKGSQYVAARLADVVKAAPRRGGKRR